MSESHLYNIRLLKSYIEFIKNSYPTIDISSVLEYAGIAKCELDDAGYWFTQEQADRFIDICIKMTGDSSIARKSGRFLSTSEADSTMRRYLIGFVTPSAIYSSAALTSQKFTRGAHMQSRKLDHNKFEIISKPEKGVNEKPYQCENRMGILEAVPMIFAGKVPNIDHPECIHKGDEYCRYVITWEEPLSFKLKRIRNYITAVITLASSALLFYLPWMGLIYFAISAVLLILFFSYISEYQKHRELLKFISEQSNTAEELLEEINTRYNNALLVQEVGHAISSILNIKKLFECVMQILNRRTDFERGMVMLADQEKTRLIFAAGYGYDPDKEDILNNAEFHLNKPGSMGIFVKTFREKTPYLVSDIDSLINELSERSRKFVISLGTKSFIAVPIVFKDEPLGILAVDNVRTKRPLTKSDMNLLSGIAQQMGISINNARSFIKLQASEEKYRELVEHANSIIMRIDTKGRIIYFNEFAQNFFGYSEEELIGQNITGTILSSDNQYVNKFQRMLYEIEKNPDKYLNIQSENILRNMKKVWIAWTNRPVSDNEGKLKEILCVGNDISEVRRVEEKIEHLNELLLTIRSIDQLITHEKNRDSLINKICDTLILTRGHINSWIVLFDKKGIFERGFESGFQGDFYKLLEKFKNYIQLQCCRRALSQPETVVIAAPDLTCGNCEFNSRYANTGRMLNRLEYNDKIYGIMSVEVESCFISNDEEPLLLKEVADEIAFALYNIELEEERKSLQGQLFQSAKLSAVGQLAAGVAHEFNNILNGILGHAQLSQLEESVDNIKESLQDIERATKRGSGIVRRLSEFAKPREPEFEIQDIVEVIKETIKLQKKQLQIENMNVRIEFGEHSNVLFDRGQMGQAFLNLLINSIHAMKPAGRGNIVISVMDIDRDQEIRFSDTGSGMSKETMSKIFEPFFSTKGVWSKDNLGITGTGLGLSVTHAIIKQHKGKISVESEEGKGTTFIIKLPIPEEKNESKIEKVFNKLDMDDVKTKNLKIMVIDDEEEMINLMKLILKKTGISNFVAEKNGSQAVRIFRDFSPDVVFLDMLMPGMDGEQVLEKLKKLNHTVPVVFMSGQLDLEEHEYKGRGVYSFLKKPFDVNSIFQILNKVAREKNESGNFFHRTDAGIFS